VRHRSIGAANALPASTTSNESSRRSMTSFARLEALEQTVANRAALDLVSELAKARERRSRADPLRS
jgi:hypothetical protein